MTLKIGVKNHLTDNLNRMKGNGRKTDNLNALLCDVVPLRAVLFVCE